MRKRSVARLPIQFTGRSIRHLSVSLYPTVMQAFTEPIINGFDACWQLSNVPRVDIYRTEDEIIILDYGKGMTPEETRERFLVVGESAGLNSAQQEAQFGFGKWAPFAFADDYTVRTEPENKNVVYTFELDLTQLEKARSTSELSVDLDLDERGGHRKDPRSGTFTMLIIKRLQGNAPTAEQIAKRLPNYLPILTPWEVRINGSDLPHRTFIGDPINAEYDAIPGTVDVSLAIAERASQDVDYVHLAGGAGRPICPLHTIPDSHKLFEGEVFDFRISGYVNVRAWKKDVQTAGRSQLKASVAQSDAMRSVAEGFNAHVAPILRKRLGAIEQTTRSEQLEKLLDEVIDEFHDVYGVKRSGEPKPRPDKGTKGGRRDGGPRQRNLRRFVLNGQPFIVLHTNQLDGGLPAYLNRREDPPSIFIATNNLTYRRLQRGSKSSFKDHIRRSLVEAATLYFNQDKYSDYYLHQFHDNIRRLEEGIGKK